MTFHCEFWVKLQTANGVYSRIPSFTTSDTTECTTLTSPYTQPSKQPWMNTVHPGTAAREQERTTRQFFFNSWRGAALRAPISTPALQRAPAGLAQPLLCPSYSPLNRRNFLSMFYLMAEINFCLQTPWLLPDTQQSLTNCYSTGNCRESDREQKGYQSNNKNSDGENIIMNNIRFALNSELVSPCPIKIHYCVLSSEMWGMQCNPFHDEINKIGFGKHLLQNWAFLHRILSWKLKKSTLMPWRQLYSVADKLCRSWNSSGGFF